MIFCGFGIVGMNHSGDYVATDIANITFVKLTKAVFDEILISKNVTNEYSNIIEQAWDFDTILHALFDGNLHAGNVDFTVEQVSKIRIKRRKKNSYDWITLFEVPIEKVEDFDFERIDRYARSNQEYEYALVPVIGNAEGNLNINSIYSEFEGIYLVEKNLGYGSAIETSISTQKNRPTTVVNTLGRRTPYVITNGKNNYYSGQVSAIYVNQNPDTCEMETESGWQYREAIMEFLCDGKPKILKSDDGRIWMVNVVGSPSESENPHPLYPTTSFEWVEIGDIESSTMLYENNFIDVNVEGS